MGADFQRLSPLTSRSLSEGRGGTGFQGGGLRCVKIFAPKKYGMVICPVCDGKGFLIKSSGLIDNFSRSVCAKWGGFGAIKKDEKVLESLGNQVQWSKRNRLGRQETV